MARRARPLAPRGLGVGAALALALLTLGPLAAVALAADPGRGLGPAEWGALRFTVAQAAVSAVLSVGLAVPVARALARRRFPGRGLFVTLLGAPFILPVVVAVFGLLAVFGRSGLLNDVLAALGGPRLSIYGFGGVVLAHVFFNLPLAVRLILQGWAAVPAERFRLAASLGAPVWTLIERPMLARIVPGALALIFLICLSSFAVALILGGGPRATTVELAIYQALRFDGDLGRAALLAAIQVVLCLAAVVLVRLAGRPEDLGGGLDRTVERWDGRAAGARALDAALIALAGAFLILPMAMVVLEGVGGLPDLPGTIWTALGRSLLVALGATVVAVALGLALAVTGGWWATAAATLPLAVSALVLGTGLLILTRGLVRPEEIGLAATALVNGMLAVPFAARILAPAAEQVAADHGRLAEALGLTGWRYLRIVAVPRMIAPLGFAAGLTAAFSIGDLGVITLFTDGQVETLPLAMYRLMGSYRTSAAEGAALLLLITALAVFVAFDRGGRGLARP